MNVSICARCGHEQGFHDGTGLGSCGTLTRLGNCSCLGYEESVTIVADDVPQERSTFEVSCELLEWVEGLEKGLITPAGQREIAAIIKPKPVPLTERLEAALREYNGAYGKDGEAARTVITIVADHLDREAQPGAAALLRRSLL